MNHLPAQVDGDDVVRLPHQPLPTYYAAGDTEARTRFLRETFDATAIDYDRLERLMGLGTGPRYRYMALQRAGLKPGGQVLDVGMGTGLVSQAILRITGEPERLIGVDPSAGMMAQSTLPAGVECRLGRAEQLPIADASVDFLVMGYALRHVADFSAACAEFRRVLKPGGRLLILEISRPQTRLATALLKAYMHGVVPLMARLVSKAPATPMLWRYYWDTIDACVAPPQVLTTLANAGLHNVARHVEVGVFSEYTALG
jgi:demethylmenaquinone methyltransferase/2-methoxy-6-polyprenyl-1,4-benzoquinol methylase